MKCICHPHHSHHPDHQVCLLLPTRPCQYHYHHVCLSSPSSWLSSSSWSSSSPSSSSSSVSVQICPSGPPVSELGHATNGFTCIIIKIITINIINGSSSSSSSLLLAALLLLNAHREFQCADNDDNTKMHCVQIMLCNFESYWSFEPIMSFPGRFIGPAVHHHHYWSSKPMTNVPSGFVARADANARH